MKFVKPLEDLAPFFPALEKPARYAGGEYGRLAERKNMENGGFLRMAACFPDLYEIGMSNQAVKILYNSLNAIPGIVCDRAFAPAPDFEKLLLEKNIPLYGLDTGAALGGMDILCFSLGYEPGITGMLSMLECSGIALRAENRNPAGPVVLIGGPCTANPLPFEIFADAFWIGEAEGGFFDLARRLAELKREGKGRAEFLSLIREHPSVYFAGRKSPAVRALDGDFSLAERPVPVFPVPSMKTVQLHGAVEIMRGCPNGCRFCQAGIWYRPMRQKNAAAVARECAAFIEKGGYGEISLSSLSSGDYRGLAGLLDSLNGTYASRHVSFQLPSLRISSFSLGILEKVSEVRRSGLTFAVETPGEMRQLAINKKAGLDSTVAIIQEAKRHGWRGAKFYFMTGLPLPEAGIDEAEEIIDFVRGAAKRTGMHFSVNVGIFVPKPHTPFQWAAQAPGDSAARKLSRIRGALREGGHRVSTADPFVSLLEGFLSRGDERAGEVIEEAWRLGARLDAWDEHVRKDIWKTLFEKHAALLESFLSARDPGETLPWARIDPGTSTAFLREEWRKSLVGEMTESCGEACGHPCGICPERGRVAQADGGALPEPETAAPEPEKTGSAPSFPAGNGKSGGRDPDTKRILFSYSKTGSAVWLSHLSLIEIFSMSLRRAGIPVLYSQGYNPLPKLDFAAPLSLGIRALGEIAVLDLSCAFPAAGFRETMNRSLPEGLAVEDAAAFVIPSGAKKHAPAPLLWGFRYKAPGAGEDDRVRAKEEKSYRERRLLAGGKLSGLCRTAVLAAGISEKDSGTVLPFFDAYRNLYGEC